MEKKWENNINTNRAQRNERCKQNANNGCLDNDKSKDTLIRDIKMEREIIENNNDNRIPITRNTSRHRSKSNSRQSNDLFLLLRIIDSHLNRWLLVLLFALCADGSREQKFAIEPQDQSAVVGSRVTLPCRVVNKAGQLQWTKDDFGLGTHRHLTGYERYMMIGSDEEGDYSLDIRDVRLDDDGLYQCQVSTGPRGEMAIRSRYAKLLILAPPDPPRILQGPVLQAIEDRDVKLECVSVGGKPAAEITWVDSDGGVLTQGVTYSVEPMSDGHRFTARSTLHIRPRRYHHNQSFICQAQNTADRAYKSVDIRIEVKYAPKVKVVLKSGGPKGRIAEGNTLSAACEADANPSNVNYKWFIDNELIDGNSTKDLVIVNVSRKYNEAAVKCEVYNSVGRSSESKTLEVTYGPSFILRPESVEAEIGSTATLSCIVDGNPRPEILWLHYDTDRVIRVGKSFNLTVTVSHQSAGLYWCKASVFGFPEVEAQATVFVKGPPKILSNLTQYGVEGNSVRVECTTFSVPKPDYIVWKFGGYEINSIHNQDYTVFEETLPEGITKSTLIIGESQYSHFGRYNCSVANIYGSDSVEIYMMPDKSFPLILIVAAGSSAASLVAVLLLLIILCHRRRRKNVTTDVIKKPDITVIGKGGCNDRCKESDRSSNISDLKLELRHVEGSCEMDNSNGLSDTDFQSTHMTSSLGLGVPLAGPVSLPVLSYDTELLKQYHRYSSDFGDPPPNMHFKYLKSMSRSIDTTSTIQCNSGYSQNCSLPRITHRQGSCGALSNTVTQTMGPDVIPITSPSMMLSSGLDVRYAATYGNPYLRSNGQLPYPTQVNTANPASTPAPPPYYALRTSNLAPVTSSTSPSSSSSSRPVTSPMASTSSSASSAQPQVSKLSPQVPGSLYILPAHSRGSAGTQITAKGNTVSLKGVAHV